MNIIQNRVQRDWPLELFHLAVRSECFYHGRVGDGYGSRVSLDMVFSRESIVVQKQLDSSPNTVILWNTSLGRLWLHDEVKMEVW